MKSIKEVLLIIFGILLFFVLLEFTSYAILRHIGINPFDKASQYAYGRKINGYYVTQNVPNYTFGAFDGLNNFKPGKLTTDSNGFISDGPLPLLKKSNTVRIFITGGSTAFGSIQNKLAQDNTYPSGSYTYNSGIAGILIAKLRAKFPKYSFEVVNCAVVQHKFHQNYLMYLATLHNFKPDIVINMDGFNDGDQLVLGTQFNGYSIKMEMENMLDLAARSRQGRFPMTVYLANYFLDKYTNRMTAVPVNPDTAKIVFSEPLLSDYKIIEPQFIDNSKDFLWLINSYESQLRSDSVYSVFCLQPILSRREHQKQLSALETKIRGNIERNNVKRAALNSSLLNNAQTSGRGNLYDTLTGLKKYYIESYLHAYYYDEYLSPHIDSLVRHYGGSYIDVNERITQLKSTDEFYVDYCHLTPSGNEFVADLLLDKVEIYLAKMTSP